MDAACLGITAASCFLLAEAGADGSVDGWPVQCVCAEYPLGRVRAGGEPSFGTIGTGGLLGAGLTLGVTLGLCDVNGQWA